MCEVSWWGSGRGAVNTLERCEAKVAAFSSSVILQVPSFRRMGGIWAVGCLRCLVAFNIECSSANGAEI